MAESHLFSLVIADNRVSAVKCAVDKRDLKIIVGDSAPYDESADLAETVASVVENCAASSMICRLALGPEFFFFRTIDLPFSDKKQIDSILAFEIQDNVSLAEGDYVFDYLVVDDGSEGTRVLALLLKNEVIRELLALLGGYNLDPEVITISGAPACNNFYRLRYNTLDTSYMLTIGTRYAAVYLLQKGNIVLMRSIPVDPAREAGFHVDEGSKKLEASTPELADPVLQALGQKIQNTMIAQRPDRDDTIDIPWYVGGPVGRAPALRGLLMKDLVVGENFQDWQMHGSIDGVDTFQALWPKGLFDEVLALASCPNRDLQSINFRKDEFARRYDRKRLFRIVRNSSLALLAVIVLAVSGLLIDYQRMKTERDGLAAEVTGIYRETVPEGGRIVNPLQQLQVKVNELKSATSTGASDDPSLNTLVLLGDVSERIPESLKVTFQRYIYDRKSIRIKGLTDNFNTVDQMKRSLDKSPYFSEVAIVSANVAPKDDGVRFELKLQL